jgi:hypothetical protein
VAAVAAAAPEARAAAADTDQTVSDQKANAAISKEMAAFL